MQLTELARTILWGTRWEDKLLRGTDLADDRPVPTLARVPAFPGRPRGVARGKADFPRPDRLRDDGTRGRLLHFFANHELLAMELMALMLLKFPTAPRPFRLGIARTIAEEQEHLCLYLRRMQQLGVGFGEMPVSDYFWNAMKDMRSPLEFVVQMSLTFEQANLDFSLHYQRAVARAGDEITAALLERVYRDEIAHVRHGLTWFNRWRPTGESEWEAYVRLLPPPMTPRRAKGPFFCAEGRREAGLSEPFIRELEVHGGSRGKPPVFWLYNPRCEIEIANGRPTTTAPQSLRRLALDLETLPMFAASSDDVVLVREPPRRAWLKGLASLGFETPEFRKLERLGALPRERKIAAVAPWGWSPEPFVRFRPWRDRLPAESWARRLLERESFADTGLGELFAKTWSTQFLRNWLAQHPEAERLFGPTSALGETLDRWEPAREHCRRALAAGRAILAKAPWGASGARNRRVKESSELEGTLGNWMRKTIHEQGAIVVEPWLENLADLSLQIEVDANETRILGVRQFFTDAHGHYRGTRLDFRLSALPEGLRRFLHAEGALARWYELADDVGKALRDRGYLGPAGLDAMLWRDSNGEVYLKPLVELNPRLTMGRIALELEHHVEPGTPAEWRFVLANDMTTPFSETAHALLDEHPPQVSERRGRLHVTEGIVATNDPHRAREVLALLVVGDRAAQACRLHFQA